MNKFRVFCFCSFWVVAYLIFHAKNACKPRIKLPKTSVCRRIKSALSLKFTKLRAETK